MISHFRSRLAMHLYNEPLLLSPKEAGLATELLTGSMMLGEMSTARPAAGQPAVAQVTGGRPGNSERGYNCVDGVAIIQVAGLLVHKLGLLRPYYGLTGMDGIRLNFLEALEDPEVRAIVFSIDSPGGEVAGCFDLADTIYRARGTKPLRAICSENAYSGAYAIASACDRVSVPRTGGVGSIGVISILVDWSKALTQQGIGVRFVHFGARKAEELRAQLQGVSKGVLDHLQQSVDMVGNIFVETVARNRGLSKPRILAQEAACFAGTQAVAEGLADEVAAPYEAFAWLLGQLDTDTTAAPRGAQRALQRSLRTSRKR